MSLLCEWISTWIDRYRWSHWVVLSSVGNTQAANSSQATYSEIDGTTNFPVVSSSWSCFDFRAGVGLLNGVRRRWISPSVPECERDRPA
jgi:hypothetical protein